MISKVKSLYGKVAGAVTGAFIFLTMNAHEALAGASKKPKLLEEAGNFETQLDNAIDVAMYIGYALIVIGILVVVAKYLFPGDGHEKPSKSLINWGIGVTAYFICIAFVKWLGSSIIGE